MRTFYILGGIVVVAVLLGATLFFFGPSSLQSDVNAALVTSNATQVPFTVLAQGTDAASPDGRTNYRIKTNDELVALWAMIYNNGSEPAMPTVDFTQNEVLAVFDGSHSTAGYNISISSVTDSNGERTVVINHSMPGSTCAVSQGQTDPFEIIEVPLTSFALTHQDIVSTTTCQ